jgi:hypothetical protein
MSHLSRRLMLVVGAMLASASLGHAAGEHAIAAQTAAIPMFAPQPSLSIDRDLPPAVRVRMEREQRAVFERMKAASKLRPSTAAGCEPSGISGAPAGLGPPAPVVTARILGHHVEVVARYAHLPSSDACRPALLNVVVHSGRNASPTFNNAGAVGRFLVSGPQGRAVVDLPWQGKPPYHLSVSSSTILDLRGRTVDRSLPCPGSGDPVKGCLSGYVPAAHSYPLPKPVLPLRGIDRPTLEASLQYVVSEQRSPEPSASLCSSLSFCEITYVDPAFPPSPYRIRYRIAGQQISGCWMGMREAALDPLPYPDAGRGPLELAGCASWVR